MNLDRHNGLNSDHNTNRSSEIQEHTSTEQIDIHKQSNNGHSESKNNPSITIIPKKASLSKSHLKQTI